MKPVVCVKFFALVCFDCDFQQGRSANVENVKQMISKVKEKNVKFSVEIEKTRPVLTELFPYGDVVVVSKDFATFSGFHSMSEAVKGFLKLVKPG